MNLLPVFITVFSVLLLYHIFGPQPAVQITFERVQQFSGADVANFTNLQILGVNDTIQFLNGTWELLQDLDNNWIYFVRLYYQPPVTTTMMVASGTFYPIKIPNLSIRVCDYLNSDHYQSWWTHNRYAMNYPKPQPGRWICPFPKGEYYVSSMVLEKGLPPWISKVGLYKMEFGLVNNEVVRMVETLYFRLKPVITHYRHNR